MSKSERVDEATGQSQEIAGAESHVQPDSEIVFEVSAASRDRIGKESAHGLMYGAGSQISHLVLTIATTAVLARLLEPEDFGLVAMAAVVAALIGVMGDFGLPAALIQRDRITRQQASSVFWANFGAGLLIGALLAAISPLVALLYDEPRLIGITIGQGAILFIANIGSQHSAILRRQLRFRTSAIITVVRVAAGAGAGIAAAALGAGYWSLVIMPFTNAAVGLLLKLAVVNWWPGRPAWDAGTREMLGFGANVTGSAIIQTLSRQLDNFLVGRFAGAEALGFYTRAFTLMVLPPRQVLGPARLVSTPALSRLKDRAGEYIGYYVGMVLLISSMVVPGVLFLVVVADEVVAIVLGDQWDTVARLFRILSPGAIFGTIAVIGMVYQSWGHVDRELRWQVMTLPISIGSLAIGAIWGMEGVAYGYSISRAVLFYPSLRYGFSGTPLGISDFHRAVWRPVIATAAAAGVVLLSMSFGSPDSDALRLASAFGQYWAVYLAVWIVMPGGRNLISRAVSMVRRPAAGVQVDSQT